MSKIALGISRAFLFGAVCMTFGAVTAMLLDECTGANSFSWKAIAENRDVEIDTLHAHLDFWIRRTRDAEDDADSVLALANYWQTEAKRNEAALLKLTSAAALLLDRDIRDRGTTRRPWNPDPGDTFYLERRFPIFRQIPGDTIEWIRL